MEDALLHLAVSNKPHPGLDILLASTARLPRVQTRVLGLGSKTPIGHGSNGFGLKLELLKQELQLCPPLQPVLFTDAWDVVLQESVDPLLQWLRDHPGKVLFAAETSKWPDANLEYPIPLQFPFPYLNSGCFCGRAQDILRLLHAPFHAKTDDQLYYSQQFVDPTNTIIELDHRAEFFLCMYGIANEDVGLHKGYLTYRDKKPIVLHLNNGATRLMWFPSVVSTVLQSKAYVGLARKIVLRFLWDTVAPYVKLVALALVVWIVVRARDHWIPRVVAN
jgi:hypothetical protein